MSIIQMYAVTCNEREQLQYQKKAIKNTGDTDALRGEICRELHANRYAVIHYCDEVVILLDEVAAYKAHQPIWTICLENGTQMELSGKLLFAHGQPSAVLNLFLFAPQIYFIFVVLRIYVLPAGHITKKQEWRQVGTIPVLLIIEL